MVCREGRLVVRNIFYVHLPVVQQPCVSRYEQDNDVYNSVMVKALADRLAEVSSPNKLQLTLASTHI